VKFAAEVFFLFTVSTSNTFLMPVGPHEKDLCLVENQSESISFDKKARLSPALSVYG